MRRYLRSAVPGASYFFTVTLHDRRSSFLVDHVGMLRTAVASVRRARPFRVDAMVVLPEHLHAIWTLPADDADYAGRWMLLKGGFTRALAARGALGSDASVTRGSKGERSLWQRRFWEHQIRDERDFEVHVNYIHFNPVKHGWVKRAADWPFSSFHRYVRAGLVPPDWGLADDLRGSFGE